MGYFFHTEKLSVGYDGKPVVRDIEISLKKGQILTVIGSNGSGKSTILKSIAKQLKPVSGTAHIGGNLLENITLREMSRQTAVVLTGRPKAELMTCWDVVSAGRYPYTGMLGILSENDREKVNESLKTVNAFDIKDKKFSEISDGQLQRIILARAICQEPEIIVLDEPTSFLDIKFAAEFLDTLRRMALERCVTVIMSLHELVYAKRVSDLVMCVKSGKVMYFDIPENIFKEEIISSLYDLPDGCYKELFGGL